MAANDANGILFINVGISSTNKNKKTPCNIAETLLLAPEATLAELRTITDVSGNPPINPLIILPIHCAFSSLLVGVTLLSGSSLSTASMPRRVSKLATIARVSAAFQTSKFVM